MTALSTTAALHFIDFKRCGFRHFLTFENRTPGKFLCHQVIAAENKTDQRHRIFHSRCRYQAYLLAMGTRS